MSKIITRDQLMAAYSNEQIQAAAIQLNIDGYSGPVWMLREQCRINDGTYTQIQVEYDNHAHFLHVSTDDADRVSYTKNSDKGEQDLQTRNTLAGYCEKFGLNIATAVTLPNKKPAIAETAATDGTRSVTAETEKKVDAAGFGKIYSSMDELIASLAADAAAVQSRTDAHKALDTYLDARDSFDAAEAVLEAYL